MPGFRALFPVTDGLLVTALRAGFVAKAATYSTNVLVQRKLPDIKVARMVTVRNDSGPEEGSQSRRRYGINVWADNSVDGENLALLAMAILRTVPNGQPITFVDQLTGPYEIEDDPAYVVGTNNLFHYYFTARISVRGTEF